MPGSLAWSTQQLVEYLSAVSSCCDEATAVRAAVEHAAEGIECEVAALVRDGQVLWSIGLPAGGAHSAILVEAATANRRVLDVPDVGPCRALTVPVPDDRSRLILARSGGEGFTKDETHLARGMAKVLSLTLAWLRAIEQERALREHSEGQARENAVLLRSLREAQQELSRHNDRLRSSERRYAEMYEREREVVQRLEALDDMKNAFMSAVSHELRTPLTTVLGFAQTLEAECGRLPQDVQRQFVRRIAANADKLERMLSDLLDLDRLSRGILEPRRRPTDLSALVRAVVEDSGISSERPLTLDLETVTVCVEPAKVERIVENLLANSMRHTSESTPVWVRVRQHDGGALLVVEDAGPGVDPSLRDLIFEPFRQGPDVPSHSPGVGVGLSLVARFAELHGGRAWVDERPGGGASFSVYLPESSELEIASARKSASPDGVEGIASAG